MTNRRPGSTWISVMAAAVALAGLWTGCREGVTPTEPVQQATLSIQASASGAPNVSAVRVAISSVTLVPSDGGSEVALTSGTQAIDLIQLQQSAQQLTLTSVAPGTYASLRIRFDESTSTVVETSGGSPMPLTITAPLADLPLSLKVAAGDIVTLQLSIDSASSLRKTIGGDWVFTPFLQITAP